MLEKIGLPAKPSQRGNNWVVDATHCQGCSSQFTFINRKHHCRRCGGLFCNSCTQQRMFLRGQGDSPVRICDPCKKLEEAARFEMRHGHKNRAAKGSSKTPSENVDDILNQLLANDSQEPSTLRRDFHTGSSKEATGEDGEVDMLEKGSNDETNHAHNEVASVSPEVLRQKAVDEKSKYKILKREGKSAEALKAFKTAKELERQAASLELQLRKSRRKALASTSTAEAHKTEDVSQGSSKKNKIDPQKGKEKDDMTAELRALGWSDNDIHGTDQKPATSLESELLNLTGDDSRKKNNNKTVDGTDKSEVVALKKKALMLKREGKLAEAKEELKKAKILEKQLEEQEFLAEAEDSGDEISALIRSLDSDGQDDSSMGMGLESGIDLRSLMGDAGDLGMDGIFEVTDDDMHDPELAAALKNMGWDEESNEPYATVTGYVSTDRDAIENEIGRLKKEAVHQKRTGNVAEAMSLLKKAKVLEKDLEGLSSYEMGPSDSQASENAQEVSQFEVMVDRKPERKTRAMIQKELLALKKKALALRREGKLDEAEAELKKGKILEQQLEEIDNATTMKITQVNVTREVSRPRSEHPNISAADTSLDVEEDVTDQDMHDPAYLVLLKNLGWQDDDNKPMVSSTDVSEQKAVSGPRRSKGEIQRELLSLKRKALTLRRQGQDAEAEEVLRSAKVLEEQMAEMEAAVQGVSAGVSGQRDEIESAKKGSLVDVTEPKEDKTDEPLLERRAEPEDSSGGGESANHVDSASPKAEKGSVQIEILVHKRKAVALKREGKLAEAREELRKAKLLERTLEEEKSQPPPSSTVVEVSKSSIPAAVKDEHNPSRLAPKPMSSHDRFKLQRDCLSHKRNALKLRREGKTAEAEAELDLAKKLEAQLDEVNPHEPMDSSREPGSVDDVGVEDFLDPQILSALNAIGLRDAPATSHAPAIAEPSSSQERVKLEAEIKAEKVKALNLKRTGKQAEALDALRKAKQLEKKLNSLPS